MKNFYILFCLLFFTLLAQGKDRVIQGSVTNSVTNGPVYNAKVELLQSDSTVIDATIVQTWSVSENSDPITAFILHIKKSGNYLLRCSHPDYETLYKPLKINLSNREFAIEVGSFRMKRHLKEKKDIQLNEAVVSATKVKFYIDNDTMVYNADAFQLSEGSMLDALIEQLPGVELKDDGRILVNGKYVKSLLLNGKDFFDKDRKIMLDNLPSYMIKKVKVYDRSNLSSEMLGISVGEKDLVMDVNLKREYSIGYIGNVEGGLGSENRYLGRLFALRFTPHSRISVFGNINNLNNAYVPGKNGEWSPTTLFNGLQSSKIAGLDYGVYDKKRRYNISGNAKVEHSDTDNRNNGSSVNFLPECDTYGRSWNRSNNRNTRITTDHTFQYIWWNKHINIEIKPHFDFHKFRNNTSVISATFSEDPSIYITEGLLDSISKPNAGSLLRRIAINRLFDQTLSEGRNMNADISTFSTIKIPHLTDFLYLSGWVNYDDNRNELYNHYRLDYPKTSQAKDLRNRYTNAPSRGYSYEMKAEYWYRPVLPVVISASYAYSRSYRYDENAIYRLDALVDWGEGGKDDFGVLPSVIENWHNTLDANSFESRNYLFRHLPQLSFLWESDISGKRSENWKVKVYFPLRLETNRLSYKRDKLDVVNSRDLVFLEPHLRVERKDKNRKHQFSFTYAYHVNAPSMTSMLDIRDDVDPLNIKLGNPILSNTRIHDVSFSYSTQMQQWRMLNFNSSYSLQDGSVAMGYVYDKKTGIRTFKPSNVYGNWNMRGGVNFTTPLDGFRRFTFYTNTNATYYNSVDLIGVSGSSGDSRSSVRSFYLSENLRTDYRLKKFRLAAKVDVTWTHVTSPRADFARISAADMNYGLNGQVELPWNMEISSGLTLYSRYGYEDASMNTNDFVWDVRVSQRLLKGGVFLQLDGFDLLGQLSNVRRTVNTQGRFESYYNVIPRYVMLHLIYRLNMKPKKKK